MQFSSSRTFPGHVLEQAMSAAGESTGAAIPSDSAARVDNAPWRRQVGQPVAGGGMTISTTRNR
jgi:hypothetical protein